MSPSNASTPFPVHEQSENNIYISYFPCLENFFSDFPNNQVQCLTYLLTIHFLANHSAKYTFVALLLSCFLMPPIRQFLSFNES